jgi:hypothetical protein
VGCCLWNLCICNFANALLLAVPSHNLAYEWEVFVKLLELRFSMIVKISSWFSKVWYHYDLYHYTVSYPGKSHFLFLKFFIYWFLKLEKYLVRKWLENSEQNPWRYFFVEVLFNLWDSDEGLSQLESFTPWIFCVVPRSEWWTKSEKWKIPKMLLFTVLCTFIGYTSSDFTKSPAAGIVTVSEPRLISQLGRVREIMCA